MGFTNEIQKHTYSIASLVSDQLNKTIQACNEKLEPLNVQNIQKVIITGCGYSYAASIAIKDYLSDLVQIPITISPAIEVSRFSHECAGAYEGTMLVAISNSGTVSRINEALLQYRTHGATVVVITANMDGEIQKFADYLLDSNSPSIGSTLPLRGYAMTLIVLIGIGYALAKKKNVLDTIMFNDQMNKLLTSMEALDRKLPIIDAQMQKYVQTHPDIRSFEFVGSGYERAAAFLGKIEMMGQAGLLASDEDSEQWCHCNFFMANPNKIGTILFLAQASPASSRARETLQFMIHLKRPICLVTDDLGITSNHHLTVVHVPDITDYNAGFIECTVPSLLTGYVCEQIGETYSRGFRDQWAMFRDGCGTSQSEIVIQ